MNPTKVVQAIVCYLRGAIGNAAGFKIIENSFKFITKTLIPGLHSALNRLKISGKKILFRKT